MSKRLEHVEAAKEEASKLGASIRLDYSKRHIVGIIAVNDKYRKIFLSKSTASGNVCHVVREDVRRKVKEMRE